MITNLPGLDPGIVERLKSASRKLHDVLPLLDKAEACGIDVSALRDTHKQMMDQISQYQRQFFNGEIRP